MAVAFVRSHTAVADKAASTTTISLQISTDTTPGNVLVAYVLFDNATTASQPIVSSIARAAGETNTWALLGAARTTTTTAGAGSSAEMWAIRTTVAWPVATYAVTFNSPITMRATLAQEFSGALATLRSTVGTNYSTTTTAASATTTGTAPVIGDLAVGFIFGSNVAAAQAGDTDTTAGSWSAVAGLGTTGGNAATNNFGVAQYKILTAATAQTLNNSAAMTAGNGAIVAILQKDPSTAYPLAGTVAATSATTGSIGVVASILPKISTLTDTFDTQIDSKWLTTGDGAAIWETGQLKASSVSNTETGKVTADYYSLVDSSVFAKVTRVSGSARITVMSSDSGETLDISITNTFLSMTGSDDGPLTVSPSPTLNYDPVDHAYLRMRIAGTTAYWDTSPDASTWTQRGTTALRTDQWKSVVLQLSAYGAGGVTYFDNVNVVPPLPDEPGAFITGSAFTSAAKRADFGDYVGYRILVGATPLVVTHLGRWVATTSGTGSHSVIITAKTATTGSGDWLASVTVDTTGKPVGFNYVALASPITLSAGTEYVVGSKEAMGGDQWYDVAPLTGTADASVVSSAHGPGGGNAGPWTFPAVAGSGYVPPNFKYHFSYPLDGTVAATTDSAGTIGVVAAGGGGVPTIVRSGRGVSSTTFDVDVTGGRTLFLFGDVASTTMTANNAGVTVAGWDNTAQRRMSIWFVAAGTTGTVRFTAAAARQWGYILLDWAMLSGAAGYTAANTTSAINAISITPSAAARIAVSYLTNDAADWGATPSGQTDLQRITTQNVEPSWLLSYTNAEQASGVAFSSGPMDRGKNLTSRAESIGLAALIAQAPSSQAYPLDGTVSATSTTSGTIAVAAAPATGKVVILTGAGDATTVNPGGTTSLSSPKATKPANLADGDLLLAVVVNQQAITTAPNVLRCNDAAWILAGPPARTNSSKRPSGMWVMPVTNAAAISDTNWIWQGQPTAGRWLVRIYRVTGVDLTTSVDAAATQWIGAGGGTTSATMDALTTVTADALVVYHLHGVNTNVQGAMVITPPAETTFVEQINNVASGSASSDSLGVYTEARPTPGAVGSRVFTTTTQSAFDGYNIALRPLVALPKVETLVDTFDTALDKAVKWTDTSTSTVWDAGRAKIPVVTNYYNLATPAAGTYDLTGSYVYAKVTPPAAGNGSRETFMEVIRGGVSNDKLSIFVSGGVNISARRTIAGATSGLTDFATYNPVTHAWWRIRESGGTTYFDTSPDGTTWTQQWSVANGFAVTKVWVNFSSGYWGTETAADAFIDNVNAVPVGGTAYPLDGVVSAITTTSGVIGETDRYQPEGSVSITGDPVVSVARALDGVLAAVSTTSGTISAVYPLAGTAVATSTTVGTPIAVHPLGGAVAAISVTAGTLGAGFPLASTVSATTTTSGTLVAVHPLAGTVTSVSTNVGNPTAIYGLAGTAAGISATTGTINMVVGAQDYPLAGILPAVSATSGSISAVHPLAGTTDVVTTTTGSPDAKHPLDGVTTAVTTTAGTVVAVHPLTGTAVGTTDTTGTVVAVHPLAGTVAGTSGTTGALVAVHPMAGATDAITATIGTLQARVPLAGTVAGTSVTTGAPVALHPLDGTAAAVSSTVGAATAIYRMAGTASGVSTTAGTINMLVGPQDYPLIGVTAATTTTSGTLGAIHPLAGATVVTSTVTGDPIAVHPLVGSSTTATTTTTGTLVVAFSLVGVSTATSTSTGTLVAVHPLAATVDAFSTAVVGNITAIHPLAATTAAISTAAGSLVAVHPLVGIVAATSTTSMVGTPVVAYALAGTVPATSETIGSPTARHPLAALTAAVSTTTGTINFVGGAQEYPLSGAVAATSTTSGAITATHPLSGVVAAVSATPGNPTSVHPLSGSTAGTSTTTGNLTADHPLAGVTVGVAATTGFVVATHPLVGAAAAVTTTSGTINVVGGAQSYPLAGSVVGTSFTVGTFSGKYGLAGVAASVTTTIGDLAAGYMLAGASSAVTTVTGVLEAMFRLSGTVAGFTGTSGDIGFGGPLAFGRPKLWVNDAWQLKPAKVWTELGWVEKPTKIWDGVDWEVLDIVLD